MNRSSNMLPYFIGMVTAMLLWGLSWTVGKVAVEHANAHTAAFWRYVFAFFAMLPVIWWRKSPIKTDLQGLLLTLLASLLTAAFNFLFFLGLAHGQAGYGGTLVTAFAPIFTYVISIVFLGVGIRALQGIALLIGVTGTVIFLRIPWEGLGFLNVDSLYFLEAALIWAVVTVISQKAAKRIDIFFFTLTVFGLTALINLVFALPYHPFTLTYYDMTFWYAIIFMGVVPGAFSTAIYFFSAGKIRAHRAGAFMFLVPVGAILSSWAVYHEKIEMTTVIGALLAFLTVVLFNAGHSAKQDVSAK